MRTGRLSGLVLVFSVLAAVWVQPALADEAAAIYDPSAVVFIDLTLSPAEEAKLEAEPGEYVKGTFSMTKSSDGTPAGEEASPFVGPRPAEIRLKGNVGGSFRDLKEKAAFKLKFKKTEPMLGLRKMTLNNMVQDPSMVHETLAYAAFRAAGVPASRTGYAYVRLNGEDLGVYLDLENLDETALAKIFGSFDKEHQHLYEGEDGHDVRPGEEGEFEIDEGSETSRADLEALIGAVNGEDADPWSQRVSPNADLAEMTKMWAVEKYIDHWDGYSGHAIPGFRPNNYYLYSDSSGRFQMLPWGADQTWIPTIGVETPGREVTFDGEGGVLFNKCLEDGACFDLYRAALRDVTSAIAMLDPQSLAEATASLLAPWQAEEIANGRPEYDATEIKEDKYGVEGTLAFIAGRRAEAEAWLAENEPPVARVVPPAPVPPAQAPPRNTDPALISSHAKRSGRYLKLRLDLRVPAGVTLRATFETTKGKVRACSVRKQAAVAGEFSLRCKLSRVALSKLAKHTLRTELTFTVAPAGGQIETVVRDIRLPRD